MQAVLQLALLAVQAMVPPPAPDRPPLWCKVAGFALIGVCGVIAMAFALVAIWLFLTPVIGARLTALAIAVLALLTAMVLALLLRRRPNPAPAPAPPPTAMLAEVERLVRANLAPSLLAALIAGVMAGSSGPDRS